MAQRMTSIKPRFPITVEPRVALPPRLVERHTIKLGEDGELKTLDDAEWRALPDEWVLRELADAKLDNDEAVLGLLSDYGWIEGRYPYKWISPDAAQRLFGDDQLAEFRRIGDRQSGMPDDEPRTLEDARWWLKTARALAGTWSRTARGEDPAAAWTDEGFSPDAPEVWERFRGLLNEGLEPFSARVVHRNAEALTDLYSAACLQIFNLLVQDCHPLRCENETCDHDFVHQRGGAEHRQHRSTGLRYCTPECARMQASRKYRRKAKEREAT